MRVLPWLSLLLVLLCSVAKAETNNEVVALYAGALMAQAETCQMSPTTTSNDFYSWMDKQGLSATEQTHLQSALQQSRMTFRQVQPENGCADIPRLQQEFRSKLL
jgi:hypothetical protein